MAKVSKPGERPRRTSEPKEAPKAPIKGAKGPAKIEVDEDDPLKEIRSAQKRRDNHRSNPCF